MNLKDLNQLMKAGVNVNKLFIDNSEYTDLRVVMEVEKEDVVNSYIHTSIKNFDYSEMYVVMSDGDSIALVPRHKSNTAIVYNFNNMILLEDNVTDICDNCKEILPKDLLLNFYPELNHELNDLKDEYIDYDGMFCCKCYSSFKNKFNII